MIPRQSLPESVLALAARQDGVLATRQLLRAGVTPEVLARLGSQWQRPAQGLYLLGPATWGAAANAGLLRGGPTAVLGEHAAAHLHGAVRDAPRVLTVWARERRDGFRVGDWEVIYRRGLRSGVGTPSRTRLEESLLDLARHSSENETVAATARALAGRRTTPERVVAALAERTRCRHSSTLRALCEHANHGIESALEWRFHTQVLLPHGLPIPERQVSTVAGRVDGLYRDYGLIVELDGVRDHADWAKDMWRDNTHVVEGLATLRYGWTAVEDTRCDVAAQLGAALGKRTWDGTPTHCRRCR